MVDAVYANGLNAAIAKSMWSPESWAYSPNTSPQYPYDKAKAQQMLDDAGWKKGADGVSAKNGVKLQFEITSTSSANEYKAKYGTYPGYYSDAGYAKARLLVESLKKVSNPSDHKALSAALKSTPIQAARGPVKLSGAPAFAPIQNIYICQVKSVNGELRNVPIKTYAKLPPWGPLSESEWRTLFEKDSSGRP